MNNQIINKSGSRIRIHWLTSTGPVAGQQLMGAKHELRHHLREMEIKFRLVHLPRLPNLQMKQWYLKTIKIKLSMS